MIGNWELYGMSEAEMFYALADANLDAAIVLANALCAGSFAQTFSNAKVIMSLHHHGVELFFKYALSRGGQEVPTHHHIGTLAWRYSTTFTDSKLQFDPPFVKEFLGFTSEQLKSAVAEEYQPKNKNKTDQQMRYHTDREGNVWPGAHGVLPVMYAQDLLELRKRLQGLHELIEKHVASQALKVTSEPVPGAVFSAPQC